MKVVDIYKGIEVMKGFRGASTVAIGTHKNVGKKSKVLLDSIIYFINGVEYSYSLSRGADYSDYKKTTRDEIDMRIRQHLPRL